MTGSEPAVLRALIVDDEPAARRLLTDLLNQVPDVEPVGSCRNGREALAWLASQRADLLFLDVEMPGMSGFDVLEGLGSETEESPRPAVIFVTAHDDFAIRAFEADAWDYLLKPFDGERLEQALERVRKRLGKGLGRPPRGSVSGSPRQPAAPRRPLERLAVPQGRGRVTIRLKDVLWIQAESNYARFHLPATSLLARMSLTQLESRLDPEIFVRIHRSTIVNVERIERLESRGHGDMALTLEDGQEVTLSRRYRARFDQVLESLP